MATANGVLTPPAGHAQHQVTDDVEEKDTHKRKREDEDSGAIASAETAVAASKNVQVQRDILEVLRQYDTQPSFLKHAIAATQQPSPKKARLSDKVHAADTISTKLDHATYTSLVDLQKDAAVVSRELVQAVRDRANERDGNEAGRLTVDDLKQMQRLHAFEVTIRGIVERETTHLVVEEQKPEGKPEIIGTTQDARRTKPRLNGEGTTVLTLFGNAPTPRQLFSSMQSAAPVKTDTVIKTELPVEEVSLPIGLTATKVMPVAAREGKPGRTFEEAFPPPYSLPPLQPPKSYRRPTTRDASISWEFKDTFAKGNKKGGYTVQPLTVGDWLGYGGVDPKDDTASPREKRKQRDRALSVGEATQHPRSKAAIEDAIAKEEEALFRRAYSSFAPTCDNTKALVPEETKNLVWWHKVGHKRFDETFALDPALVPESSANALEKTPNGTLVELDDEELGRIVEDYNEMDDEGLDGSSVVRDKTKVDQVLKDISNLLETLASHQRIRNASLPSSTSASRTPISPAPSLASRAVRPASPAEDEIATYKALQREIAYLVLKLPPYAVAKLDGDQLSELGVSRLLTFKGKEIKGTMEEDQVARLARHTAMATAAGIASLTRSQPGGSGQHYSSTNQRAPAIGQAANTRYGQFNSTRTPITQSQYQRSSGNQASYGTPSMRLGYGAPNQRIGVPIGGYGQPNAQHYFQRPVQQPSGGYAGYPQQYQSTPHTQQRPIHSTAHLLAPYQQRGASNAAGYHPPSHGTPQAQAPSPFTRTMSPIKPAGYNQSSYTPQPTGHRPSFSAQPQQPNADRATPVSYPSQPPTPINGTQAPSSLVPPGTQGSSGGTPQPSPQAQQPQTNGHV